MKLPLFANDIYIQQKPSGRWKRTRMNKFSENKVNTQKPNIFL